MIIIFADKNTLVGRFLSTRPLRWIGLISYSAYLWHQPLLAFVRLRFDETPEFSYIVIAIIAVFPLSTFSYFYIEQPFRQKKRFDRQQIFISAFIGTIITFIVALFLIQTAKDRPLLLGQEDDTYLSDLKQHGNARYLQHTYKELLKYKTFSNHTLNTNRRILLIGDSQAQDFLNIIHDGKYLTNYEIRLYFVRHYCQMYMGKVDREEFLTARERQGCVGPHDIKYALPLIREANVIILAGAWRDWGAQKLPETIKLLNLTKQQQLIVIGPKHFGNIKLNLYATKSKEYRLSLYNYPPQSVIRVNKILKQGLDPSMFVDIMETACTGYNQTCPVFTREGKLISYDGFHLAMHGALHLGKLLFSKEPLSRL